MSQLKNVSYAVLLIILLFGCKKHQEKDLSGIYRCTVDQRNWDMDAGVTSSTYEEDLDIKQNGDLVVILGNYVHIDSLWKNKLYRKMSGGSNVFEAQFINENIYVSYNAGGLGGGVEYIYRGKKIK